MVTLLEDAIIKERYSDEVTEQLKIALVAQRVASVHLERFTKLRLGEITEQEYLNEHIG